MRSHPEFRKTLNKQLVDTYFVFEKRPDFFLFPWASITVKNRPCHG